MAEENSKDPDTSTDGVVASAEAVPPGFESLCTMKELEGSGSSSKRVMLNGISAVAVFLHGGTVYAIDAQCPHQGAKLEVGDIEDIGGFPNIVCPAHGWCFRLKDGYCEDIANYGVSTYETRVLSDGRICVAKKETSHPPIE